MCFAVAERSADPSTQIGAIIVGPDRRIRSTGYNDFPTGVNNASERWERPEKYEWICHAEENAVFSAARAGVALEGCTLYMPYVNDTASGPAVCHRCCRAIIQAGIVEIVYGVIPFPGIGKRTHYDIEDRSIAMLTEGGVTTRQVSPEP